mmetsp:Transcript_31011/g.47519  ORF Transcript_31011/g.47519 Transcript_31011/m.47519 type:complete len:518 (+) Transcript_31011:246-1799(+)
MEKRRRGKRDKAPIVVVVKKERAKKVKSRALTKHGNDGPSGGVEALLPSFIGLVILVCGVMAKMGFRGRAAVAGIDLGTTNSVVCVQNPSKGVGEIECIPDPWSGSPVVPSVISILDSPRRKTKETENFIVPPSQVVVGEEAKLRIDTHPLHTLYNAKRVIGRPYQHDAVTKLFSEVEYRMMEHSDDDTVVFSVPQDQHKGPPVVLTPQQVGSFIVNYLIKIAGDHLGHDNIKSAVICVPAKFDTEQRRATVAAFAHAGITVTRMLEEPTAAALAYGLDRKENVDYIMVYDFGGGTLDVSLLHVSDGGYVEVMGSDGDDRLGGADFDAAVATHLLKGAKQHVQRVNNVLTTSLAEAYKAVDLESMLSKECEQLKTIPLCTLSSLHTIGEKLKIKLSQYPDENATVEASCWTLPKDHEPIESVKDFCSSLQQTKLSLTTNDYDEACQELYRKSSVPIRDLLADLNMKPDEIDEVVMVGGTTRMPQIRALVMKELGVSSLNTHIDPDLTVAYGAASVID